MAELAMAPRSAPPARRPPARARAPARARKAPALAALGSLLVACVDPVEGQIDVLPPVYYSSNPVARHVACSVPSGAGTVCTLGGYHNESMPLDFLIVNLPESGYLYETTQNFRSYGSDPKYAPTPIQPHELPFRISDELHRVVYVPPSDVFPPEGRWDTFQYATKEPTSGDMSMLGQAVLTSPENWMAASTFVAGADGWTVTGNIHTAAPTWQAFGWGLLDRYVYSTDEVQYLDFATGYDRKKWYFEAPAAKFAVPEMAATYGGNIRFTISSTYGDFNRLNMPLDFITLECAECNSGRGMRLVRFAEHGLEWDGRERIVEAKLAVGHHWKRDPLNSALPFEDATECEFAATLAGLSRVRILGDFTQAGEGVAIDDVSISSSTEQPVFPVECQAGCTCAHDKRFRRISCCGSSSDLMLPPSEIE